MLLLSTHSCEAGTDSMAVTPRDYTDFSLGINYMANSILTIPPNQPIPTYLQSADKRAISVPELAEVTDQSRPSSPFQCLHRPDQHRLTRPSEKWGLRTNETE